MKVKTSELTNRQLDWVVAKCEGVAVVKYPESLNLFFGTGFDKYSPSTNWSQGGPIIERHPEWFDITPSPYEPREDMRWQCQPYNIGGDYAQYGATPLIAAMKCYVASRLGEEIEVPESLL